MNTYITLLSSLVQTILGRFTYIGSNIESYPNLVFILGVTIGIEAINFTFRLMKGD